MEAQTFRYSNYALRGAADDARLVAALIAGTRPIGVVCVEHYVRGRDSHELPVELPDLLHFLQHAAGAVENVMVRAAYRTIGQAVLSASTVQPAMGRVLEAGRPGARLRLRGALSGRCGLHDAGDRRGRGPAVERGVAEPGAPPAGGRASGRRLPARSDAWS